MATTCFNTHILQPVTTWYGIIDMQVCPVMCSCFNDVEFEYNLQVEDPPATDMQDHLFNIRSRDLSPQLP